MDDDIFSDPKETQDIKEDSNMDWKKSGIDKHERLTLKVNVKEANMYNANKKRDTKPKVKARTPLDIPQGFKRVRKKIKDSYDEEDEDDAEYILVPVFMDKEVSSLELALTPQEKKQLEQMEKQQPEDINARQAVERDINLQRAEKVLKNAGLEADRKITEQKRAKTEDVKAKDLAEDNLKKRKKQKDKPINKKEEKPIKPAKELPKIKDAETKEVRKAIIDDAEKEKKSAQKELEKQQQKKEEINAVTKEKANKQKVEEPEKLKEKEKDTASEMIQQKEKQEKAAQKIETEKEIIQPEQQQEVSEPEKRELDEKNARQIILEKSGRTASPSEQLDTEILEQQAEIEKTEKEIQEEDARQRQSQLIISRSGRSR